MGTLQTYLLDKINYHNKLLKGYIKEYSNIDVKKLNTAKDRELVLTLQYKIDFEKKMLKLFVNDAKQHLIHNDFVDVIKDVDYDE